MKIKEVRELSTEELNNRIYSLKEELYNLKRKKFQNLTGCGLSF